MPMPCTVDDIETTKEETMKADGLRNAYVRTLAWRGSGEDIGIASAKNPARMAIAF